MRLIDADALLDWFDDQSDVIATTDVQALIDNWPTVSCGECVKWTNEYSPLNSDLHRCQTWGQSYVSGGAGCSFFERRQP